MADGADRNPVLYDTEGNEDDFDHEEYVRPRYIHTNIHAIHTHRHTHAIRGPHLEQTQDPFHPETGCRKFCKAIFQENSRVIWDTLLDRTSSSLM